MPIIASPVPKLSMAASGTAGTSAKTSSVLESAWTPRAGILAPLAFVVKMFDKLVTFKRKFGNRRNTEIFADKPFNTADLILFFR